MRRLRGWVTVWVLPLLAIAGSAAALVAYWQRYPDPIAVHWGLSGDPNGSLPLWLYAVGMIGGMGLAWLGLIGGTRGGPDAPVTAVVYFILGLLAAVNGQILYDNVDVADWHDAANLYPLTVMGVLAIGIVAGLLGWLLAGGRGSVGEDQPLDAVTTALTAWTGRASNLWIAAIATIPVVLVFVVPAIWAALLIVIAILLVVSAFVRVDAGESGVKVSLGPVRLPRRRYPIRSITGAGAVEITPLAYGGWGWRILPGRRAYIIRGGQAIRIERPNGVAIVVTVDDAQTGAAVIDALARARRYG
jgi:Domain of unknown function (DUF1648)